MHLQSQYLRKSSIFRESESVEQTHLPFKILHPNSKKKENFLRHLGSKHSEGKNASFWEMKKDIWSGLMYISEEK